MDLSVVAEFCPLLGVGVLDSLESVDLPGELFSCLQEL